MSATNRSAANSPTAKSPAAEPVPGHIGPRGKLNVKAAVLVALALFAQESVLNFYDAQVPASINAYTTSAGIIGLLMGVDNIVGIFLQPFIGHLSDRTRTRFGRRLPYIVIGAPLTVACFMAIPYTGSFGALIVCIVAFALITRTFKSVTESLIPDWQPADRRSTANAIAKVATSLTIIVASLVSLLVVDDNLALAFSIPAVLMLVSVLIVALTMKETKSPGYQAALQEKAESKVKWTFGAVIGDLVKSRDKSRLIMLLAIFAVAGTWAAVRSQLTPYATNVLGLTRGEAGSLSLPGGIVFMIVAVPIAIFSERLGRLRLTRIGLLTFAAGCLIAFLSLNPVVVILGLVVGAIGYTAFSVNGVVIMWNLAPTRAVVGLYTGIYGVAAALGASLGPGAVGGLVDLTSWRFFFLHAAILCVVAFVLMSLVKREVNPEQFGETDRAATPAPGEPVTPAATPSVTAED
jgi:MFS family permease